MKVTQNELEHMAVQQYGMVPPLVKQISAVSTSVAYHYLVGLSLVKEGAFSPIEQNVIQLRTSILNRCEACIKGHSFLLKSLGLPDLEIAAIRGGLLTSDKAVNRVIDLTNTVFDAGRNGFAAEHLEKLEAMNASQAELYEVISMIASKTISNYINNYSQAVKTKVNA
ncbi:MAG TPA: carboxymuconolactone decarboxylase family protein [Chryseosolibacter sp.]